MPTMLFFQFAFRKKFGGKEKHTHWLDAAKEKYDSKLVEDIKILLKVFVLYLPLPVFWALFKQQVLML
jgi:solute carrier family 15 oligopeptide transporter 1